MPKLIDIPEVGRVAFPDGMPESDIDSAAGDLYDRAVKKKGLAAERVAAERPSAWETVGRVADVVASPTYGLGRISLGGLGRLAGAGMADLITPQTPGMAPNIAAELMGMERPIQTQVALEESPVRSGLVQAAESLPTVGAGIALTPFAGPSALPLAMGAQAAEETGYDPYQTGKAVALGYALPVVGRLARTAAGVGTAAAVNRGATALAPAAVQRGIEVGAGQVGVQGLLLADILASPEYRAATPDQRRRMLIESGVANIAFGIPEVVAGTRGQPVARRFESPSVQAARMLAADPSIPTPPLEQLVMPGREPIAQVGGVSEMGPIRTPGRAVIAGPPNVQQQPVAVDILPAGIISPSVVGPRIEPPRPVVIESGSLIVPEVAGVRQEAPGGQVSFAAEAPTLLRNVPDMTADALRAEARATSQPPTPPESAKAEVPPPSPVPFVERVTPDAGGEIGAETRTPQRGGQGGEAQGQPEAEVTKPTERTPSETQKEVQGKEILTPGQMTAAEINKRLDKLDAKDSKLIDEFIAAGRGYETPNEYLKKSDPLSIRAREIFDERSSLRNEVERRYGPGAPSRLPTRGFGPTEKRTATDRIVAGLESLKKPETPGTRSGGVPISTYNLAIDTAIKAVKAGKSTADAINEAVGYAKSRGPVDEPALRKALAAGIPAIVTPTQAPPSQATQAPPTQPPTQRPPTAPPPPAGPPRPPSRPGPGQRERQFMARAIISPEVPKAVQEAVAKNPERYFDTQNVPDVVDQVSRKTDAELAAGMMDRETNTATAHGIEAIKRAISIGNDAGAEALITTLAQRGTTLGQLVNQYKLLRGAVPEFTPTIVDKWLKQAGYDPLTKPQRDRITDLARDSITAETARKKADAEYLGNPTPERWQAVSDADAAGELASLKLNEAMARMHPRAFSDVLIAVLQGNLLTPISQTANVAGNATRLPLASSARTIAATTDAIQSALTGAPRTQTIRPFANTWAKLRALPHAARVAGQIVRKGADTAIYEAGQTGGVRLNAFKAMRELRDIFKGQADLPTRGGKVPLSDVAERFLEASFGAPADVMLRGLGTMDAMFRIPERARLITEAAGRIGLNAEQTRRAVNRPELFLPKSEVDRINFESARAVYQQENVATGLVSAANRQLRRLPWLYAASKTVIPYQKTPINVGAELLSYTPLGGLKLVNDIRTGNRAEANLQAGKLAVGAMMTAATLWLMKNGLISPPLDASDESEKVRSATQDAIPPNHINISGLKRVLKGESGKPQPGDDLRDLTRMGLPGGHMYMTAWTVRRMEKARGDQGNIATELIAGAPTAVASWALNQSFLQGVSSFIKDVQNDNLDTWFTKWLTGISAVPLPNTLTSIARALRNAKPEFRDDSLLQAAGNKLNEKANMLGFSVPVGRETKALPMKVDLWGRPMRETPAGANPFIYNFFDVTRHRNIPDDPLAIELYGLWRRTTDNSVFPSLPDRKISVGRVPHEMNWEQYQNLAMKVGQMRRKLVEAVLDDPQWAQATDDQKIKALGRQYERGRMLGEAQFLSEQPALTPRKPRLGALEFQPQ